MGCASFSTQKLRNKEFDSKEKKIYKSTNKFVEKLYQEEKYAILPKAIKLDSIYISEDAKHIELYFNKYLSYIPVRMDDVDFFYQKLKKQIGWRFKKYSLEILTLNIPIEKLVPNYFRPDSSSFDISKMPIANSNDVTPIVKRKDWKSDPKQGLKNRNIALWHSHGWYYSNGMDRWEWQRPRLFQTVEDLFPFSYVVPYLVPMLENAGANVFLPRERDWQVNEVIVDNDNSTLKSHYSESNSKNNKWQTGEGTGFNLGLAPYETGENPFAHGSYRYIKSDSIATAFVEWIPEITENGDYCVYISYKHAPGNIQDASYTVYHTGGKTEFLVNQQIGGGTWIYLGKFSFDKGQNPESGKVLLSNRSETPGKIITADAVRFGGGMGDVKRGKSISYRPRFAEGARYYLQYAGMPDTLIYNVNDNKNDYKDDYTSRAEWVNYLIGSPNGPNKNRNVKGLGIPIDLSFSFHTDAGIRKDDKVIGTLSIYSIEDLEDKVVFPNGVSRVANRDLADIVQTQIVKDARAIHDFEWTRRALFTGKYSEAYRPNVPSMLLELLSHQNFQDMKFGLDPKYKFDMSRAIYKGFLKYLANSYGYEYVVQPLPVTHFSTELINNNSVKLKWKPNLDKLEPTAQSDSYIVYTQKNGHAFDNGILVDKPEFIMDNLESGMQYSFKVTAVNKGGESFPSEILSVCYLENSPETVLIVNNFDRISSAQVYENGNFKGFANYIDEGVPDKFDIGYTGVQHDFDFKSQWLTNDYPGWGSSSANYETKIIAGNMFDYPFIHGKSIKNCGYSYVSTSEECIESEYINMQDYQIVDMIFGEEKATRFSAKNDSVIFEAFTDSLKSKITQYCQKGGNLFISGAYIGSELFKSPKDTSANTKFGRNILKYNFVTNHASASGRFYMLENSDKNYIYSHSFNDKIYKVEAPDAIIPSKGSKAKTFLRFRDNEFGAGIKYIGQDYNLVMMTIPFEAILNQSNRDELMKNIINTLKLKKINGEILDATSKRP